GTFSGCMPLTTSVYDYAQLFGAGNLGPYMVDDWTVDGVTYSGSVATMADLTDSMNVWNPSGNWAMDIATQKIVGGNSNSTYADIAMTVTSINAPSSIPLASSNVYQGAMMTLSVGTHWVKMTKTTDATCVDSFFVNVLCVQPSVESFTVEEGSSSQYCFDHGELLGQPSSVEILCPNNPGTPVDFNLISGNACVQINAQTVGQDSACYVFCDEFGICDTTTIHVLVTAQPVNITLSWMTDTIFPNTNNQVCIDTTELNGTVVSMVNGCAMQSGEYVMFDLDTMTYCVDYSAVDIGQDTACIYVTDDMGNIDTTYLVVTVTPPPSDTLFQNINLGDMGMFCIDTTQLGGIVNIVENICGSNVSNAATFTFGAATYCYTAITNEVGQDTACIVVCDNFGVCDTTILIANVMAATPAGLVATDDQIEVFEGATVSTNICNNDSIPNDFLTNYYILTPPFGGTGPNYGTVDFDSECNISYTSNGVDCNVEDHFEYVICNVDGCDTATVSVIVKCNTTPTSPADSLEFVTGFSPNGDDVNQYFTIKGAETLPQNTLTVFNRWGNQVYKAQFYQNDWDGTWNGTHLQNGTYFYLFDDGVGNTYTGYVYLQN
ncbi:MAG TPA: gliding motility-associated C-terminal domain-containing protein, partial [Phaeodactylibacter sp.]|nr:gliding motility-associated C-terminal domain-containing protein [Phaeodactylibacter sp.]